MHYRYRQFFALVLSFALLMLPLQASVAGAMHMQAEVEQERPHCGSADHGSHQKAEQQAEKTGNCCCDHCDGACMQQCGAGMSFTALPAGNLVTAAQRQLMQTNPAWSSTDYIEPPPSPPPLSS